MDIENINNESRKVKDQLDADALFALIIMAQLDIETGRYISVDETFQRLQKSRCENIKHSLK